LLAFTLHAQPLSKTEALRQEMERIGGLVEQGALPRSNLSQLEAMLEEAKDDEVLSHTLYGKLTIEDLTKEQAGEMVGAAQRQIERQAERMKTAKTLVDQGVAARTTLTPYLEELESRRKTLDLAESRARLLEELAAMALAEEEQMREDELQPQPYRVAERYDGDGEFEPADLRMVMIAYRKQFARALPVSALGETALHRSMGFDHRGRVDVALNPDQMEGLWLRRFLEKARLPYFAFRGAISGRATAPHIHLGPPSLRLRVAD